MRNTDIKINNSNVIKSISYDQEEILNWILSLYIINGRFDYDPTYSKGNFYKGNIIDPKIKVI